MTNQEKSTEIVRLYTAYASGEILECRSSAPSGKIFSECFRLPNITYANVEFFRVKPVPVMAWYRVGILFGNRTVTADSSQEDEEILVESITGFKCWLTDRIEYEVQS